MTLLLMKWLSIVFLISAVSTFPAGRGKQLSAGSTDTGKDSTTSKKCFFSETRKSPLELKARPVKSVVSSACSGKVSKLEEVVSNSEKINGIGSDENPIALIACRGTGSCDLNLTDPKVLSTWKIIEICDHHADELLRKWGSNPGFLDKHVYRRPIHNVKLMECSMPKELGVNHGLRPHKRLHPLSVKGSNAILTKEHVLVHPGIPICPDHQDYVEDLLSGPHSPPPKKSKTMDDDSDDSDDSDSKKCFDKTVYHHPQGYSVNPLRSAFLHFAKAANVHRVCAEKPWDELEATTKARKASTAKHLIETMYGLMVPDKTDEFQKMVEDKFVELDKWTTGSTEDLDAIMNQISAQYHNTENRKERLIILSMVANSVSYLKVEKYIKGLSPYMYDKAKKFARRKRSLAMPQKSTTEKYNRDAVESFIEFITSPTVMTGLPYGVRNVKFSDGSRIEIPDSIRQQTATEIIEMYTEICQDDNRTDLLMGTSTMYNILKVCAATKREASTCVDYYVAVGMEAFEGLHNILDHWNEQGIFDTEKIKQMKRQLLEAAQYFRTDFRLHVKSFSRVADHCATFALSDPNDSNLTTSCSDKTHKHTHDLKCERCERANMILELMKVYANELVADQEKAVSQSNSDQTDKLFLETYKREVQEIEVFTKNILEMKKHLLRAAFTNEERSTILSNLKDNEALVTMDFAQKFLPKWHREKQVDYYGKKGISYHVSHVAAKVGDTYVQHSFVHIYQGSITQDSKTVILTVSHFLPELKKVGIQKVFLRSDNAGAYHCSSTLGSLHLLMAETGMQIGSYTFSETQNGKSSSDRDANRVKRKVKEYIAKGKDVTTSADFFNALKENPLNGVSVFHGNVTPAEEGNWKWPGISSLNYFIIEKNGIRAKKYGEIGKGIFVNKSNFKPINGTFEFSEAGSVASNVNPVVEREAVVKGLETKFWYYPKCMTTGKCATPEPEPLSQTEDELVPNSYIGDLYPCPEHGCSASYLKFSNLEKHILKDQHHVVPETILEIDYALRLYGRSLEDVRDQNSCQSMKEAVTKMKETQNTTLLQGWALPEKRTRKPFEKNVIKFLLECFNKGVTDKKPMNPLVVAGLMRDLKNDDNSPRFSISELKDVPQIAGFFQREADKRRHEKNSSPQATGSNSNTNQPHISQKSSKTGGASTKHRRRRHRTTRSATDVEEYIEAEDEHRHAGLLRFIKIEEYWTTEDEYYNATINTNEKVFEK